VPLSSYAEALPQKLYIFISRLTSLLGKALRIPASQYSLRSFLDYLSENAGEIFETESEGKWLKSYLLYVNDDWQSLFLQHSLQKMGDVWHFTIADEERSADYYVYEWKPGLILCFTGSTKEDYEKTLRRFVTEKRGISEAWISPPLFENLKNHVLTKYSATMYSFISRRSRFSEAIAKIGRQEYNRRMSYSGEDASDVLKETQLMYGTISTRMDFRIGSDKIQLNRNGMVLIRDVNESTISILLDIIGSVSEELSTIRITSGRFKTSTRTIGLTEHQIIVPTLVAGKITVPNAKFDVKTVKMLFGEAKNEVDLGKSDEETDEFSDFSFIDTYVSDDAVSFSATVVDDRKGTVFGLSAYNGELALIPKYRTTFESFVRFYETIAEDVDGDAHLTMFSEQTLSEPVAR
jgi:hypothetical protein